ncbi:MAG: class I adenylate-forming enzyme family protein [Hyphomonadaceae bacterium]
MATIRATIDGVFKVEPDAEAVESNGVWWTWRDLDAVKTQFEAILDQHGLGADVRVGAMLRNLPACVATLASIVSSDRCVVTLNPALPDDKLANDVRNLELPVVVGMARDWERPAVKDAALAAGVLGIVLPETAGGALTLAPGLEKVKAQAVRNAPGIAIEMLTSGTTGPPKRIPLKKSLFEKMLNDAAIYERDRQGDDTPKLRKGVNFVMVPFAHMGGVWGTMNTLMSGRKIFLLERFTVEAFMDGMRRHRPRAIGTPPSMLRMVLDARVPKEDLASLAAWRTSTAPLDADTADLFYETYGIPALQVYGATEFAGGVAGWTLEDFKAFGKTKRGSVGRINPGIEARILDPETRAPVEPGVEGVLSLRAGHLGNGVDWMDTMDRAILDADGFLFITGRFDNAIIRGGFKIIPDDVVRALEQHPAILEAAVAGLKDARLGEVPVAAFIVKSGATAPSHDELADFLRARLSAYQIPVQTKAVKELPRTPSMKVSVIGLREMFAA